MKNFMQLCDEYEKQRNSYGGEVEGQRLEYDLIQLLDATFTVKIMMEQGIDATQNFSALVRGNLFQRIIVYAHFIGKSPSCLEADKNFLGCWTLFEQVLEKMIMKVDELSKDQVIASVRFLFITTLVFSLPPATNLHDLISNPNARRVKGSYPVSVGDIQFSQTLPNDLKGPFRSTTEIFSGLEENLRYYLNVINNNII